MKIGIITFQNAENYGAVLQCKALYTYLNASGNEVEIIDYRCPVVESAYRIFPKFRKNIFILVRQYIGAIYNYHRLIKRKKKFQQFLDDFNKTPPMEIDEVCKTHFDYDLIIAGSDQIWNPNITGGFDKVYFLNFDGLFRRAGYAISLGDVNYPQFAEQQFYDYIRKFDHLSFREPDAADFVGEKLGQNLPQVLDPTLLLTKQQWNNILGSTVIKVPPKYIFVYFIVGGQSSQEIAKIADRLSAQNNIPIVYLKMNRSLRNPFKGKNITVIDAGPKDFLYLIKNATYVVTSSFHGTALSCIYQKDLSVVIPDVSGSRVKAIADMFHLQDRVYSSCEDFIRRRNDPKPPIDNRTSEYQEALERSVNYLREITSIDE